MTDEPIVGDKRKIESTATTAPVLQCPICLEEWGTTPGVVLCIISSCRPVAHFICTKCDVGLRDRKCPTCRQPIGVVVPMPAAYAPTDAVAAEEHAAAVKRAKTDQSKISDTPPAVAPAPVVGSGRFTTFGVAEFRRLCQLRLETAKSLVDAVLRGPRSVTLANGGFVRISCTVCPPAYQDIPLCGGSLRILQSDLAREYPGYIFLDAPNADRRSYMEMIMTAQVREPVASNQRLVSAAPVVSQPVSRPASAVLTTPMTETRVNLYNILRKLVTKQTEYAPTFQTLNISSLATICNTLRTISTDVQFENFLHGTGGRLLAFLTVVSRLEENNSVFYFNEISRAYRQLFTALLDAKVDLSRLTCVLTQRKKWSEIIKSMPRTLQWLHANLPGFLSTITLQELTNKWAGLGRIDFMTDFGTKIHADLQLACRNNSIKDDQPQVEDFLTAYNYYKNM